MIVAKVLICIDLVQTAVAEMLPRSFAQISAQRVVGHLAMLTRISCSLLESLPRGSLRGGNLVFTRVQNLPGVAKSLLRKVIDVRSKARRSPAPEAHRRLEKME
jgi:hypothetical protein